MTDDTLPFEMISDCHQTNQSEVNQRDQIRQRLLISRLLDQLSGPTVILEYDGYGDSGGPQNCTIEDAELTDFLWDCVEGHHAGFWNHEGGQGRVIWDLVKDEITIEHSENVMTTCDTVTVF